MKGCFCVLTRFSGQLCSSIFFNLLASAFCANVFLNNSGSVGYSEVSSASAVVGGQEVGCFYLAVLH